MGSEPGAGSESGTGSGAPPPHDGEGPALSRREIIIFLAASGASLALAGGIYWLIPDPVPAGEPGSAPPPDAPVPRVDPDRCRVGIVRADSYAPDRVREALRDLARLHPDLEARVRGKRVFLKPNLVERDPEKRVNTHPEVIGATIDLLRDLGAREVVVGDGPAHRRDAEVILRSNGLDLVLRDRGVRFVDLNTDDVAPVPVVPDASGLHFLMLPVALLSSDVAISMPRMKTHHYAGATLTMKNLFGVVPGSVYGWPKNVLHWRGIARCTIDILGALVRLNRMGFGPDLLGLVDGIVGMEGDGPLHGTERASHALVLGTDLLATDCTCFYLMGLDVGRSETILNAGRHGLGIAHPDLIDLAGEEIYDLRQDFALPAHLAFMRRPEAAQSTQPAPSGPRAEDLDRPHERGGY